VTLSAFDQNSNSSKASEEQSIGIYISKSIQIQEQTSLFNRMGAQVCSIFHTF